MQPIQISAVSYLNTKPFIYGLYRSEMANQFRLNLDIPVACAEKLRSGEADLVLCPVALIPELPAVHLVSDYCIGAVGAVETVCIYAACPLEEIESIFLDFNSKTSVMLTQVLCAHFWKIRPKLIHATPGYEQQIGGNVAGLVIGDRAFEMNQRFPFIYDLSEIWYNWTGLPFVFATWLSIKPLDEAFLQQFNKALETGINHIPELIKILPQLPGVDLESYFSKHISYNLDAAKYRGLERFLSFHPNWHPNKIRRSVAVPTI